MTAALVCLVFGLLAFAIVLLVRLLDARSWRRSLVAFRLYPPAGLTTENVTAQLGSLSALTHASWWWVLPYPPLVIEIEAYSPTGKFIQN